MKKKNPQQTDRGCTKSRKVTAPISLEELMVKELPVSLADVVTYLGQTEFLSKQKRYICNKMNKPRKLMTRHYVGLVRNLNPRMAQMPPLFNDNQQLDKSEIVDSLANKSPRTHKAMIISQSFISETGYLKTFVEH